MEKAGSHVSYVSHLGKQGSTHCGGIRKRLKGCKRPLKALEKPQKPLTHLLPRPKPFTLAIVTLMNQRLLMV